MTTKAKIILAFSAAAFISCGNPQSIPYFQDLEQGSEIHIGGPSTIRIRPGDKLSIIVNTRDQQISNLFNLPYTSRTIGMTSEYTSSYSQGISAYTVDPDGNIDFPVVGPIKVEGKTRAEIASHIKEILLSKRLAVDPVVTVEYSNLRVSVLGEVTRPGRFAIDHDEYTIMDAISAAGDLTIFGLRDRVKVLRTVDGIKKTYTINLCSAEEVLKSPVYYLQQNDIVYVEPNQVRARQSTVNGNNVLSTSFWISISSLAVTVLLAIKQFTN